MAKLLRRPHVCNDHREPDSAVGVANRDQMHARRNGSDGCLLEACLAYIVRRRLQAGAGECRPVENVPDRKSDVKDADWISDLLAHGLIRPSFVPARPTQEMRTLLRTRKQLVRQDSGHLSSWACMRPRSDERVGKRRSTRIRKGSAWLKTTLVQLRMGGGPHERQLSASSVPPHQSSPRPQEGDHRRRCLHPHRHLSHAQGWNHVSRPRP
jgi:Transposase